MEVRVSTTGDGSTEPGTATAVTADPAAMAAARERAGRQGLLFDDDLPHLPEDMGYRGPTACAAAGITYRQLDYWARTGLVEPGIRSAHGSGSQRLYSFRDILVLKVVKRLLDTGVSLQNIRTAVSHLRERGVDDLAQITLMSDGASVYECTSPDEVVDLVQGGQGVFGIAVGRVWREVEGSLAELPGERADGADAGGGCRARRAVGASQGPQDRLSLLARYHRSAVDSARESSHHLRPVLVCVGRRRGNIPGTSQATGPCGRGDSGARVTEGETRTA